MDFFVDLFLDLFRLLKNDVVNRFWVLVELYCVDIINEDVNVLEDILNIYDEEVDYFRVFFFGKYYVEKWVEEDFIEE